MSLSELRSLVRRFVAGEIAYDKFRAEFVPEYLSVHHDDAETESDVNEIENASADFDEGDISEQELKDYLRAISAKLTVTMEPEPFEARPSRYIYVTPGRRVA